MIRHKYLKLKNCKEIPTQLFRQPCWYLQNNLKIILQGDTKAVV